MMKRFHLEYSAEAEKCLEKMDCSIAKMILAWMKKNIDGCENPRAFGKALSANRAGQWRYRIGAYRVLCFIEDERMVVLVVTAGHRRDV
jgi:mRNA interferase RelE/StbE